MPHGPALSYIPSHVAIIMDGNGRWATKRLMPRQAGHRAGIDTVRRIVREAGEVGVKVLTLYTFSSENWRRPMAEVSYLMDLFRFFFRREIEQLHANGVQVRFLGERGDLAADILKLMAEAEAKTQGNEGMQLNVAINYGSQRELSRAALHLLDEIRSGQTSIEDITPERVRTCLYDPQMPDPDIVIRTGGDQRLSNFLLWQAANAKLYYTPVFWPDFSAQDLHKALTWLATQQKQDKSVTSLG